MNLAQHGRRGIFNEVRLFGYVVVEVATGLTVLVGSAFALREGLRVTSELAGEAYAAELPSRRRLPAPAPLDRPLLAREYAPITSYFLGVKDEILVAPLLTHDIARVKFNRGGSSISLRIDFVGGGRAAFKPDQTNPQTVPRKEIAAYRLSRMLGLEAVAPAVGRRFLLRDVLDKLDEGSRDMIARIQEQVPTEADGTVAGELSWWIPIIVDAKIEGQIIDTPEGMAAWHRHLTLGEPEPYSARVLLPQVSNMIVFDYLINNSDRWSGSNAKTSPDRKTLFFMDNTLSFGIALEGSPKVRANLEKVQKFSRALLRRVRSLDEAMLRDAMGHAGPYERLLGDGEIAAVLYRRDALLAYLDGLLAEHSEAEVLCYP